MEGRRGITLIELIFVIGLSLAILNIGFQTYVGVTRASDVESRRESAMLTVQNLMARIKQDIRSGSHVSASGGSLSVTAVGHHIAYVSGEAGTARIIGRGRSLYRGVAAGFSSNGSGVRIDLTATDTVHRRPIRIEITSFASPRN